MSKIFSSDQARERLPFVRSVLADLSRCVQEIHEVAPESTEKDHDPEIRMLRKDLHRYVEEIESLGCYVRYTGEPHVLFPATRGPQLGFFRLRADATDLEEWAPAKAAPVERNKSRTARASL
jgi:hypothetical protein